MRVGELAERCGVSVRALRYYEECGLLSPERTPSGQRIYCPDDLRRVRFFQLMYAAGLTSQDIAAMLPCIDTGHTTAEQRELLYAERERINDRMNQLRGALYRLDKLIAAAEARTSVAAS